MWINHLRFRIYGAQQNVEAFCAHTRTHTEWTMGRRSEKNTHRFHNRIIPAILAQICISVCVKVNYYLFFYIVRPRRAHQNRSELPHRWLGVRNGKPHCQVCFDYFAMRSSVYAAVKRNVNNDTNVYDYYNYLEAVGGGDGDSSRDAVIAERSTPVATGTADFVHSFTHILRAQHRILV